MTNEIKEIEKSAKGIVSINFGEKPKKKAIQNIKKEKKSIPKPFMEEILDEKPIKTEIIANIEDLQKEIDNQKKALELKIKEAQAEKVKLLKEEKAKKKAERKERRRKHWYFRMFMRKPKILEIKEIIYQNPNEVKLIELDYTNLKRCPLCNAKIRKYKVEYDFNTLKQLIKCKKCDFQRMIAIKL